MAVPWQVVLRWKDAGSHGCCSHLCRCCRCGLPVYRPGCLARLPCCYCSRAPGCRRSCCRAAGGTRGWVRQLGRWREVSVHQALPLNSGLRMLKRSSACITVFYCIKVRCAAEMRSKKTRKLCVIPDSFHFYLHCECGLKIFFLYIFSSINKPDCWDVSEGGDV